jgi:hypothetical protein
MCNILFIIIIISSSIIITCLNWNWFLPGGSDTKVRRSTEIYNPQIYTNNKERITRIEYNAKSKTVPVTCRVGL